MNFRAAASQAFSNPPKSVSDDYTDYTKYISKVDPAVPRAFIRSVVREIVVTDGEVESIDFQSGVKCIFTR